MKEFSFIILFVSIVLSSLLYSQQIINTFDAPGPDARGLAWDGSYLWLADSRTDSIYRINPDDGSILSSIYFDIYEDYGGLAWDEDTSLWLANKDSIFNLNPETGVIIKSFFRPGC